MPGKMARSDPRMRGMALQSGPARPSCRKGRKSANIHAELGVHLGNTVSSLWRELLSLVERTFQSDTDRLVIYGDTLKLAEREF
jgi:hypothetical protein